MIEIDENFSSKNRKLHTKFILFIFLLLYLYCTRNIDCSWKIFLGEKLVIFRRGQMVNDRGEWEGRGARKINTTTTAAVVGVGGVLFLRKAI